MRNKSWIVLTFGLTAAVLYGACSENSTPTGSSGPLATPATDPSGVSSLPSTANTFGLATQQVDEDFNCTNVQDVHVRLGSPGWVNANAVGLFVEFRGFTETNMTLRVWWDFENAPEDYEDIVLEEGDVRRSDDLLDLEKIIEHTYDISQPTRRRVRVELILADQTGNCARVRDVDLTLPVTPVTKGAPKNCPSPGIDAGGYCWVIAQSQAEPHATACARIGKSPTANNVVGLTWDAALMGEVTGKLGCTNLGDTGCCATALWYNQATNVCQTHNFGAQYTNYGPWTTSVGVFTCNY